MKSPSVHYEAMRSRQRRAYIRDYQRNLKRKRRAEWIAANGPCVKCGSSDRLEVDHRDPATKAMRISSLWLLRPYNPRLVAELKKCQVLCYSCHKEKTKPEHSRRFTRADSRRSIRRARRRWPAT